MTAWPVQSGEEVSCLHWLCSCRLGTTYKPSQLWMHAAPTTRALLAHALCCIAPPSHKRRAPQNTQAMQLIQGASDPSASHNCFAWKAAGSYRSSDDGEPGGTAGGCWVAGPAAGRLGIRVLEGSRSAF